MQLFNAENITKAKSLQSLLQFSCMQPWLKETLYVQDATGRMAVLCEHALVFKKQLFLIIDKTFEITHQPKKTKSLIQQERKKAIYDAHHKLIKAIDAIRNQDIEVYTDKNKSNTFDISNIHSCYLICITNAKVNKDDKVLTVSHDYGSSYFAEECVLDFDDEDHTLQIFSFLDFVHLVSELETMPDLTDFLAYHRQQMIHGHEFANEKALLAHYISAGHIFQNARVIDKSLVEQKLRPSLALSLQPKKPEQQVKEFLQIKKAASFWQQVLQVYAGQVPPELLKKVGPHQELLKSLISESIYSRYTLVQCIDDFIRAPVEQKKAGYMVHFRSYSNPLRHYAFLFYAHDPASEHHRDKAKHRLKNVAGGINYQEQNPHLEDIIVIGLQDNNGEFGTDMYFLKGSKIDAQLQSQPHQLVNNAQNPVPATANNMASHANNTPAPNNKPVKKLRIDKVKPTISNGKHAKENQENKLVSRNALCPCGSGKKFRHCHGAVKSYGANAY